MGGVISEERLCRCGIPQGTVLGPIYFIVYMERLLRKQLSGISFSFADDTVILVSGQTWEEVIKKAESSLAMATHCLGEMGMLVNFSKTNFIAFGNRDSDVPCLGAIKCHDKHCVRPPSGAMCGCPDIKQTTSVRYLGVEIDQCLRWDKHINMLVNRLRKLVYICREVRGFLSMEAIRTLYFALVQSLMIYGISGWGGASSGLLGSVSVAQKLLIKVLLKKNIRYPSDELFKRMNVLSFLNLRDKITIIRISKEVQGGTLPLLERGVTRDSSKGLVKLPFRRTTRGQLIYDYRGGKLYNALPEHIRAVTSTSIFKTKLGWYFYNMQKQDL